MKNNSDPIRKTMIIASCIFFIVMCVMDALICGRSFSKLNLAACILSADTLLLLIPSFRQNPAWLWYLSGVAVLSGILSSALQLAVPDVAGMAFRFFLPMTAAVAVTQADGILRTLDTYKTIRPLFKSSQVMRNIEDRARLQKTLVFYVAMLAAYARLWVLSIVILLALFILQVLPHKRFVLLPRHKFLQILAIVNGRLKDNIVMEEGEGKDMAVTYRRTQEYMENNKPYLNPSLSLESLAKDIGTNKVYLSRTINVVSGSNFCQFVNYYRVKYSKELMRSNPGKKMIEIAMASGFNSVVTFNMAFKLNENLTPSEWLREYCSVDY